MISKDRSISIRHEILPVVYRYGILDVQEALASLMTDVSSLIHPPQEIKRPVRPKGKVTKKKLAPRGKKLTPKEITEKNRVKVLAAITKNPGIIASDLKDRFRLGMTKAQLARSLRLLQKEKLIEGKGPPNRHRQYFPKKVSNGVNHEARA